MESEDSILGSGIFKSIFSKNYVEKLICDLDNELITPSKLIEHIY